MVEAPTPDATVDYTPAGRLKKWLFAALRVAISVGLLWLVARNLPFEELRARLASVDVAALLGAVAILGVVTVLSSLRWRQVCASANAPIGPFSAWRILIISTAMDQFVFNMSGDAFRIWWIKRHSPSLTHAFAAVILDRVIGVVGLILLMLAGLPFLVASGVAGQLVWVPATMAAAGLGGLAVLLTLTWLPLPAFPLKANLVLLSKAAHRLFLQPRIALGAIAAAAAVHIGVAFAIEAISLAIGAHLSVAWCLLVTPAIFMVTLLPISVGGWGVREAAMVVGLGITGVSHNDALLISVAFGLLVTGISLAGVVTWLFGVPDPRLNPTTHQALTR